VPGEAIEITPEELELIKKHRAEAKLSELPYPEGDPRNPNPGVAVGPRLRSAEQLKKDFEDGVRAKGARFIARISSPKKDPIKAGASPQAEAKFRSKMTEVLEQERRRKILDKMDFADWGDEVAKLRPEDWVGPTVRKADKWGKKWDSLLALRLYAAQKLDAMPVATKDERRYKMDANLECQLIIGEFSKGVITESEARSRIDTATR